MIVKHAEPPKWVTVDRRTVNDQHLSFRARGLLVWLLDKPDDWQWSSDSLAIAAKEGRDAIRAALRELESLGYMRRVRRQLEDGRWVTESWIYERPEDAPKTDFQSSVFQAPAAPKTDFQSSVSRPSVFQALSSSTETEDSRRDSLSSRLFEGLKPNNKRVRLHECADVVTRARAANVADHVIDETIGKAIAAGAKSPNYVASALGIAA